MLQSLQAGRAIAALMVLCFHLGLAIQHYFGASAFLAPFGHAGEEAMNECMKKHGSSFEHNRQSLRIVTVLEDRSKAHSGLNLSQEILEGLMKHRSPEGADISRSPSLEAQVVNFADEVAYTAHDTDDGLRAGQFTLADIEKTFLGKAASLRASDRSELRGSIVDFLVTDLYEETERRLNDYTIRTLSDVYASDTELVGFSVPTVRMIGELRKFLWDRLYKSPSVLKQATRGKRVITTLFRAYMKSPPAKVRALRTRHGGALEEAVKDYIAGMTDTFAMEIYERL